MTLFSVISMTVSSRSSGGVASTNSSAHSSPTVCENRALGSALMKRRYPLGSAALLRAAYRVGGKPTPTTDPVLDRITA